MKRSDMITFALMSRWMPLPVWQSLLTVRLPHIVCSTSQSFRWTSNILSSSSMPSQDVMPFCSFVGAVVAVPMYAPPICSSGVWNAMGNTKDAAAFWLTRRSTVCATRSRNTVTWCHWPGVKISAVEPSVAVVALLYDVSTASAWPTCVRISAFGCSPVGNGIARTLG